MPHTMKLAPSATDLLPLLNALHTSTTEVAPEPPPIILNKHCLLCPFQRACHAQAEQEDNLSLLDGVTARVMRQYEKKGIFTVKQLAAPGKFESKKLCSDKRSNGPCTLVNFCSSFFLETLLCVPSNATFLTIPCPR